RDLPFVLDMVDVDSAKWAALAETSGRLRGWVYGRESRTLREFEHQATRHAFATLVVNQKEHDTLETIAPGSRIEVIQNGVDADTLPPSSPPSSSPVVVFCGVMNYEPNIEGAVWLAREVWPHVLRRRPDARLEIVGSDPTGPVLELAQRDRSVTVT